ncbi:VOC family protein [Thalassovita taeanensis]|uniref:Catechol 2,3-dioxygenase n=1 Tax=Thalassovita taeanensis TaxID=657014 RepID=A0A1H9C8Q6_9RHOB|nr:VOC family protein [Thalassovita taeanensis]SEP97542.1 Catechol 2,3-dioxygenase [Thalassovita taeanensis]
MQPAVSGLDHLVLTVADIAETVRFYEAVLGMTAQSFVAADGGMRWALGFGAQKINLHQLGAEFEPKARRATAGSADLCFLSDVAVAQWQAHFAAQGVAVEAGPVARTGAGGPIVSLYLRDPDGNLIEVSNRV